MTELQITTLRLDQPGIRGALGELESEVMELVWARPDGHGITVREVWEALHPQRGMMYTTIMNTMTRLAKKGVLRYERKEPAYVYFASLSREAFVDRFVGGVLESLLVNFGGTTREHLRKVDDSSFQARLDQVLEDLQRRRAAEEPG